MRTTIIILTLMVLTVSLSAQKSISLNQMNGRTCVSLISGNNTVATIPCTFPDRMNVGTFDEPAMPGSKADGFDWVLKFSASGKVFKDVSFADPLTGYIVTELGSVYKTVNGGENWVSKMNLGFPYYWYGVDALTADTVVISGFNNQGDIKEGVLRWTFNGGNTWTPDIVLPIPVSAVGWLDKVHFFNPDTGIVFNSFSGGCWYTFNGGKDPASWTYCTINPDLGWFAGNVDAEPDGRVYATGIHFSAGTSYGTAWNSYPSADDVFDGGVDFLDQNELLGWTGGGQISAPVSGWIHRTTDGGQSWSQRLETFTYPIRALCFLNEKTGIAVGGNLYDEAGGIHLSNDGGTTWNLDKNTAAEMFAIDYRMISQDSMDFWCVGSTGGVTGYTGKLYKARTGNLVTATGEYRSADINQAWLGQAIPNPAKNFTVISYFIPGACNVSLKLYDLFGKEVITLVNGLCETGSHSIRVECGGMAAGLYYYRLSAGNHTEIKKLLLKN